ncbi:DUF7619 domain-containing protein [Fluviicola chungangensis]|uniref:T9SS type A sorting domain-containing protein n=1 Tax=Fluviicola chungangensis TaxID=2597671 RepID=A0A556MRG3_9FLAO|nr:T9SS type A sorting domain-containing protein [Fluviicola chungangensis]TSJ42379.1 T9SS type A sorting domain-containing protein [Fluviicola chungangensis]
MKHILFSIFFLTNFFVGLSQISDFTMANNGCQLSGQNYSARGPLNFIPNGHFNTGSTCSNQSTTAYSYFSNGYWSDNFSSNLQPHGIPSVENSNLSWGYPMYWKNESSVWQATNISHGYMYIHVYKKNNTGVAYRNYILIELTRPLEVGKQYNFQASFNTYNSTYTNVAPSNTNLQLDRIGFALTDSIPDYVSGQPLLLTPFYETPRDSIISLANHNVNTNITGNGQRYLIIGNFHENDSIAFNAIPANNSHATYAFDALKLYDPNCTAYGNVYLNQNETISCAESTVNVSAQHGVQPYKWILNGNELPSTIQNVTFDTPMDTSILIVQTGVGNCISRDSMKIIPRYYNFDMPSDTTLYCNRDVDLTPAYSSVGGAYSIGSFIWREQSNPGVDLGFSSSLTISDTGTYILEYFHSYNCLEHDTIHVGANEEILMDSLSVEIGPEHCINMLDGYIEYDVSQYPGDVHFYWDSGLLNSSQIAEQDSLDAGLYEYYIFDDFNRCSLITTTVPILYDSCSVISGRIYLDTNLNCQHDIYENGLKDITVFAHPIENFGVTDSLGYFEILVPPGVYSIEQNLSNSIGIGEFCNNPLISITNSGLVFDSIFIGDTIHQFHHNPGLQSFVIGNVLLSDSYSISSFKVANFGDSIDNITVGLYIDHPALYYDTQIPEYIGMNGDTAMYLFMNMQPMSSETRTMYLPIIPNVNYIGDQINSYLFCKGEFGDIDTLNNDLIQQNIVLAAYDPNIKVVTPIGEEITSRTEVKEREFIYTIHFQNTGNAIATNVTIIDTLSHFLDLSTFQLMNSSHYVNVSCFNNEVRFEFPNIYLPDSTTDEENSKGFVQYKIYAQMDTYVGDTIRNIANIVFDNNPPIITPPAINIYYKPAIIIDTTASICDGSFFFYHGNFYDETGNFADTISSYAIDTVYQTFLTVHPIQNTELYSNLCVNDSIEFFGSYIKTPGEYSQIIMSQFGCDSTIVLHLENHSVDVAVSYLSSVQLSANLDSAIDYQWMNCQDFQVVPGAINQNFEPISNGSYAVIINDGVCMDTSNCYSINSLGLDNFSNLNLSYSPNPVNDVLTIHLPSSVDQTEVIVFDVNGKELTNQTFFWEENLNVAMNSLSSGIYIIKIRNSQLEMNIRVEKM